MRKLFCLFGLFATSLSASGANEWLYYKHYPWVYDNVSKDWLYLKGAAGGDIYAYRSSTKEWEKFTAPEIEPEPTWGEQYEEWLLNPEPYGGLDVLQKIKGAKESGATYLDLQNNNISDISPLAGLINLTWLNLHENSISDISSLAGLTNLTTLALGNNSISEISPLAVLTNLTALTLINNSISDIFPLAGLTNLTTLALANNSISEISPLAGLTNLDELTLNSNNIADITPLGGLTNLDELYLINNNITDLSPLSGLTNLTVLWFYNNSSTASQKAMLEEALPNTTIYW